MSDYSYSESTHKCNPNIRGPTLECLGRGDSIILTFHVPLRAKGQGICDIDRVLFSFTQSHVRKLGSSRTTEIYR